MKKQTKVILLAALASFGLFSCNSKVKEEVSHELKEVVEEVTEAAVAYKLDADNSLIHWEGYKPTATHTGTISLADGTFKLNGSQIAEGNFTIDMKSINVTDLEGEWKENLENHLMGTVEGKEDDFFNVNNFPTAEFKIKGITEKDGEELIVGDLTLKGITNEVAVPVKVEELDDSTVKITSADFDIDRTRWEIKFGSRSFFDSLGDNFVNDNMQLKLDLKASRI